MGQLRSSIDQFKGVVRSWLSKVKARGQTDIYQPLERSSNPAESPEAYKLYADYQERIHELNLLIRFLQQSVSVAQQCIGAIPNPHHARMGRVRLIPIRPPHVPTVPDTQDAPLGVRLIKFTNKAGGTEYYRSIDPRTISVSHPGYKAVLDLIQVKADLKKNGPRPLPRVPSLE